MSFTTPKCDLHPYFPMPQLCLKCLEIATTHPSDTDMQGTSDLSTSTYPELDANVFDFTNPYQIINPAPINTAPASFAANSTWTSRNRPAPFIQTNPVHDHYSDRFALSPVEQDKQYAGNYYTDAGALSPIEKLPTRKREKKVADAMEADEDTIIVDVPGDGLSKPRGRPRKAQDSTTAPKPSVSVIEEEE